MGNMKCLLVCSVLAAVSADPQVFLGGLHGYPYSLGSALTYTPHVIKPVVKEIEIPVKTVTYGIKETGCKNSFGFSVPCLQEGEARRKRAADEEAAPAAPVLSYAGLPLAYDGYQLWMTAMPVRVMRLVGVETLLVTNAAGGLNAMFTVGDIMVLKDHINLPGFACQHPLRGPNDERFGPRFFPTNDLYNKTYRDMARKVARDLNLDGIVRQGVYAMVGGPNYETVAELKMLRELGVDSVGLSTIPETIVAHHCGMKVFACSLITNMCVVEYNQDTNHEEVLEWGKRRSDSIRDFITKMVETIHNIQQ